MKIGLNQFRQTFVQESTDHIAAMETGLIRLRSFPNDAELLNSIFRSAHSIKGGAGSFGMRSLVQVAHSLESLLDRLRSMEMRATDEVIAVLLQSVDVLRQLLFADVDAAMSADGLELDARIRALLPEDTVQTEINRDDLPREQYSAPKDGRQISLYKVEFRPGPKMFSSGTNPIVLLRNLAAMGTVSCCHLHDDELPALADLDPSRCYLSWTVELASVCDLRELREVFEFVEHLAEISIHEIDATSEAADTLQLEPAPASAAPSSVAAAQVTDGESAAVHSQAAVQKPASGGESGSIRVAIDKVDRLIDLVGELVIAHVMTAQMVADFAPACLPKLREAVAAMERNTRELQERVMGIRMLPVGTLFQRYTRTVYDLAQITGKRIRLEMNGEETEIDKSMLESLGDPLTHLIRNAADHGIESVDARKASGKPEEGVITLRAFHRSGRIVIEVSDDGAGIDTDSVRRKAVESGLIGADSHWTAEQLRRLIFEPGFSTKKAVSDLSGRGVGMDVVARSVQQLNGTIMLTSEQGCGSTVSIELPLTLTILEGLLVRIGDRTLVLPLLSVIETVPLRDEQIVRVAEQGEVVVVREEPIPLLRLSRFLRLTQEPAGAKQTEDAKGNRRLAVIVETGRRKVGLVIDELLGQQQVVVKSLERHLHKVDGLMGATILGDGRVAPIVDVTGIGALDLFSLQIPSKSSQQVVPLAHSVWAQSSTKEKRGGSAHELV
jgi:two-component system, chemotaxis family, sensor kinase CheA